MADHDQKNPTLTGVDQSPIVEKNVRTPPDGDSPPPTPPPRPPAKKWVRFDESTPASTGGGAMQEEDQSEKSISIGDQNENGGLSEIGQLPKPPVAPRRSNPQYQQNGSTLDEGEITNGTTTAMTSNLGNGTGTGADIAQINVSVEETRRPGKFAATIQQHQQQELQTNDTGAMGQTTVTSSNKQFENGKIVTEKKPENKHCAWVTIARFDPYKMPKSLISDQLTMPVEDYVTAMEMLTNDFRFRSYTVLYRRLIAGWLVASLFILIVFLISGLHGLKLFGLTLFWLFLTCGGVLVCLFIKKRINKGLHNCVASVNKLLLRYNLLIGLEDRGKMSCHKIAIPFIYMDPKDCLPRIKQLLAQHNQLPGGTTSSARDIPSVAVDVDPPGAHSRPATAEEKAEELILKFSQSYVRAIVRRTIRFPSRPSEGVLDEVPLHCTHSYCLCQYLRKNYFERAPRKWYQRFCLDSDLPAHEDRGFASTVVAYGYPPVVYG